MDDELNRVTLREDSDGWHVGLSGMPVESCALTYTFSIQLWATRREHEVHIHLPGPFGLSIDGAQYHLDPGNGRPAELGPALGLVRRVAHEAVASHAGTLRVDFEDGTHLTVEPDPSYESWQIFSPCGLRLVCMPGGDVAVWEPRPPQLTGPAACRCAGVSTLLHDEAEQYAQHHLRMLRADPQTWRTLYRCPVTNRYWQKSYPFRSYPNGGPPEVLARLDQLSADDARSAFGEPSSKKGPAGRLSVPPE